MSRINDPCTLQESKDHLNSIIAQLILTYVPSMHALLF